MRPEHELRQAIADLEYILSLSGVLPAQYQAYLESHRDLLKWACGEENEKTVTAIRNLRQSVGEQREIYNPTVRRN